MKRIGSGLNKIVSETEKLPNYTKDYRPEFISTPTEFKVILKNVNYNNSNENVPINVPINVPNNNVELAILEAISHNPSITYDQLAVTISKTRKTIMRNIQSLKDKGLIERQGSKKNGKWLIL